MSKGDYTDPKTFNTSKLWSTAGGRVRRKLPSELAPIDSDTEGFLLLDTDYDTISNTSYTITDDDEDTWLITSASGAATAVLPTLADNYGRLLRFIAVDVTNGITLDGEDAETIGGKTTIPLEYKGQCVVLLADESNTRWTIISNSSSIYWETLPMNSEAISPGASGATESVINTATHAWLLDATNEYMYFCFDMHDDWDALSDVVVQCFVLLSAAETENDTINAELLVEYFGEHEDAGSPKTQTRTVDHDTTTNNAQYKSHVLTFVLDYDLADNVIERGDVIKCRFRLDAVGGAGEVAGVYFLGAHARYLRNTPAEMYNGTMPTEA